MIRQIATLLNCYIAKKKAITRVFLSFNNGTIQQFNNSGFSSLAFVTLLGLFLALTLTLVGTGALKLPGNAKIPVSPFPVSDPVEDDEACNDPYNADCEKYLKNDPEDLTSEQIQKALKEN